MNFQAFISYRRETGKELARLVYTELNKVRGIKTFLDIEDLGASKFDNQLRQKIKETPNFILLLTSGTLDRCKEENDWVRQEIALAIKSDKNIVPVMVEDFKFPSEADLPEDIRDIVKYNAVHYSTHYYSASIDKLLQYLINTECIDNNALLPKAAKEIQEQKDQETIENKYIDIFTTAYLDGVVSSQERDFLAQKAKELGIKPERAIELEEQVKQKSGVSATTTTVSDGVKDIPKGDGVKLLADFFHAVFSQYDEETLRKECNPDNWYESADFAFNTPPEMIEALTQLYLHYCAPVTKESMVSTLEEAMEPLSENKLKAVCTNLGIDNSGRKSVLAERLSDVFSEAVDKAFPGGRKVYPDNPDCPPEIAKWINAVVAELTMDPLKALLDEFHVDSSIRRNSRQEMADTLNRIYRSYVPGLSNNARRKFFSYRFEDLNEEQIINFCDAIGYDAKGRKKERVEKLLQIAP